MNLCSGAAGVFVEAVTETADNPINHHFSACKEDYVENDVTFQFQTASFCGVFRFWFVQNCDRRIRWSVVRSLFLWRLCCDSGVAETSRSDCAFLASASWRNGSAISKTCACDCALDALVAASAVSVTRTARKTGETLANHHVALIGITLTFEPRRIAESTRLNLFNGSFHSGGSRIPTA